MKAVYIQDLQSKTGESSQLSMEDVTSGKCDIISNRKLEKVHSYLRKM